MTCIYRTWDTFRMTRAVPAPIWRQSARPVVARAIIGRLQAHYRPQVGFPQRAGTRRFGRPAPWRGCAPGAACGVGTSASTACKLVAGRRQRRSKPTERGMSGTGIRPLTRSVLVPWISMRMVGARGFEPPTPSTPLRCATRLRYAPTCQFDRLLTGPDKLSLGLAWLGLAWRRSPVGPRWGGQVYLRKR